MDEDRKNRKWDEGKKDLSLIIPEFLDLVAGILTEGEKNHPKEPDGTPSWAMVEPEAYLKAALRHINLIQRGEQLDEEMLSHHTGNVTCDMMFYWYLTFFEQWRDVVGYEGRYQVSNMGRIKSVERDSQGAFKYKVSARIIKQNLSGNYSRVGLSGPQGIKTELVHRLVLGAFHGPCPEGCEVMHLDGNPFNNKESNLRYGSPSCNSAFKIDHGTVVRGEEVKTSKLTQKEVDDIREEYNESVSMSFLSKKYGVCAVTVFKILNNLIWCDDNYIPATHTKKPLRGEDSPLSKLTQEEADEIRKIHGMGGVSAAFLSRKYGVSTVVIRRIINNKSYVRGEQ